MTLRTRLVLSILLLVGVMATMAWLVSAQILIRPFARAVNQAMVQQAVHIAQEIDDGARPAHLERSLGVEIRPYRGKVVGRGERNAGRQVWRSRRSIVVESEQGLLQIDRTLDPDRPARRLPLLLLFPALVVLVVSVWIATRTVAPLERATEAMLRVASGDLQHRLAIEGPKEVQDAARSFNEMTARVVGMLQSERELLAGLSHELRTPLTRLRLEVSLLEDLGLPPDRLTRIEGEIAELDSLVGEALELSRLQLGDSALQTEPVDLRSLLLECGVPSTQIEGDTTLVVDRRLLARALENLLANAAKYAAGTVTVRLHQNTVEMRDRGPGVPEAQLVDLFRPFYRTQAATEHASGLGLGLMIVRQVAELHGGTVRAANAHPGLRITLTLGPRAR